MKRITISLLFLLFGTISYSQNIVEDYYGVERESPKKGIKRLETFITDPANPKSYLSSIEYYNKEGYPTKKLIFNDKGDTTKIMLTSYPNDHTEINTYPKGSWADSVFYVYNQDNNLMLETWHWGDYFDFDTDTALYSYDDQGKIIGHEYYEWDGNDREKELHTIEYKNKLPIKIIVYLNDELDDSTRFIHHNETRSIETLEYSSSGNGQVYSREVTHQNEDGLSTLIQVFSSRTGNQSITTRRRTYFKNKKLKKEVKTKHKHNTLQTTITKTYNKLGVLVESKTIDHIKDMEVVIKTKIFKY